MRVGEGEFDGELDGKSREFDAGFGEFDVFHDACGDMNPSIGARRGRGKVYLYKTKRGKRPASAPWTSSTWCLVPSPPHASPRSLTHPPVIQPGVSKILPRCHLILPVPLFLLKFYQDQPVCHKVPQPQEKGRLATVTTSIFS